MKSAILVCSTTDSITLRLTRLLQADNIDYIQLFVNNSAQDAASAVSPSNQLSINENDLANLSNILPDRFKSSN